MLVVEPWTLVLTSSGLHRPWRWRNSTNRNVMFYVVVQTAGLIGRAGFYQGAEVLTSRFQEYGKCKVKVTSCPSPRLTFPCPARLKNSRFDTEQDLASLTESFDTGLKTSFSDNKKLLWVKFGAPRDNDPRCGVKGGKLSITG